MRLIVGMTLWVLVAVAVATFRGTEDVSEEFASVGLQYNALNFKFFQSYKCINPPVIAFYGGCSVSLIDSDDLLNNLGINQAAAHNGLRRRLISVPTHCIRPGNSGWNPTFPVDDPNAPSYIGFTYNNFDDPDRVTYQQLTNELGFAPCTTPPKGVPRVNSSTIVLDPVGNPNFFSYRTLGWGVDTTTGAGGGAIGVSGNDFALLLLDQAVPLSLVPTVQLVRIAVNPYNLRTADLPSVTTAGYGITAFGDATRDPPLGAPVAINGNRHRAYLELSVNSIQQTNILAAMVLARGDATLCAGDSGSPALLIDDEGHYTSYGMTVSGDATCRATNTYTRIGTPHYMDWAKRVINAFFFGGGFPVSQAIRAGKVQDFRNVLSASTEVNDPAQSIVCPSPCASPCPAVSNGWAIAATILAGLALLFIIILLILVVASRNGAPRRV